MEPSRWQAAIVDELGRFGRLDIDTLAVRLGASEETVRRHLQVLVDQGVLRRLHGAVALPDRAQITMTVPFMRAYTERLVQTCHRRGAHAMGGMAAFIPSRRDPLVNETALARVREDKLRESVKAAGGMWLAERKLWQLSYRLAMAMGLRDRIVG